jgi:nucleotide sugar dehydrogenase
MTVTVVGLGKIGLPLAVQFALKGELVFGADINSKTVALINDGIAPFPGEQDLGKLLREVVDSGKLIATLETAECVAQSEVVIVVVPLIVDENAQPDFESIDSATYEIGRSLKKGTLVSYETTLPIGTTRKRFAKMLEEVSGLEVGSDFFVVFSPERVLTGRVFSDLRKYPKIVGGVTPSCAERGAEFYGTMLDFDARNDLPSVNGVWCLESSESAEFVKLAETTFRDVNIGLANQFAKFADKLKLNIFDVIQAANSQPFSHIHQPGVAVGGHCIPVYPQFYFWGDPEASIVREARSTNVGMPRYLVDRLNSFQPAIEPKRALVLGAAYRSEVKELAFSGVYPLVQQLRANEYEVEVFDPLFSNQELSEMGLPGMTSNLSEFGVVVIQNSSDEFIEMLSLKQNWTSLKLIADGRNLFEGKSPIEGVAILGVGFSFT